MHITHNIRSTSGVSKSSLDWSNYTGFLGDVSIMFFNVLPGNKVAVMPNPLMEEESRCVCNYGDDSSAYHDQLNARFSKVCEIFQVRSIEEFYTPVCYCGDISMPLNMTRHKTKRDWLLYLQSYSLLGGPWPFKAAKVPRPPSAVSLKVWLRETNHSKPAAICWLLLNFLFLYSKFNLKH